MGISNEISEYLVIFELASWLCIASSLIYIRVKMWMARDLHLSGSSRSSHKDGNLTDVVMWCLIVTLPVFVGTGKPRSHQCAATSGKQTMDDLQQSLQSDDERMTWKNVCLHKSSSYSCWISKSLMAAALFPSKPMIQVANSKCHGSSVIIWIIWRLCWTWWIHVIAVSLWVCNKIVWPLQHVIYILNWYHKLKLLGPFGTITWRVWSSQNRNVISKYQW